MDSTFTRIFSTTYPSHHSPTDLLPRFIPKTRKTSTLSSYYKSVKVSILYIVPDINLYRCVQFVKITLDYQGLTRRSAHLGILKLGKCAD